MPALISLKTQTKKSLERSNSGHEKSKRYRLSRSDPEARHQLTGQEERPRMGGGGWASS